MKGSKNFIKGVFSFICIISVVIGMTIVMNLPVKAVGEGVIEFVDDTGSNLEFYSSDGIADDSETTPAYYPEQLVDGKLPQEGSSSDTNSGLTDPNLIPSGSYDPGFVPDEGIDLHGIYLGGSGQAEEVYDGAETETDAERGTSDETVKQQIKNQTILSFLSGFAQGLFYTLGVAMLVYSLALWCAYVLARSTVLISKKIFYYLTFKQLDVYEISIPKFVFRQVVLTAIASLFITGWAFEGASYFVAWIVVKIGL